MISDGESLLFLNSQEERECKNYLKLDMKMDSQEIQEILYDVPPAGEGIYNCCLTDGYMKREVSIPLSPPATPKALTPSFTPVDLDFKPKAGRYNFQLAFKEEIKFPSKSCAFTYSKSLNKLFVQRNIDVPIAFKTSIALPEVFSIRAYLVFDDESYKSHIVNKCPTDSKDWEGTPGHRHIIINKKQDTDYVQCPMSGQFVTISNNRVISNTKTYTDAYSFSCYQTCRGGINKRKTSLLFALYANERCQGQASVHLGISASPGRDRKTQEKKAAEKVKENDRPLASSSSSPTTSSSSAASTSSKRKKSVVNEEEEEEEQPHPPKQKPTKDMYSFQFGPNDGFNEDREIYTLQIRGRSRYESIARINKAFEDSENLYRLDYGLPPMPSINRSRQTNSSGATLPDTTAVTKIPRNKNENNMEYFNRLTSRFQIRSVELTRSFSAPERRSFVKYEHVTVPMEYHRWR